MKSLEGSRNQNSMAVNDDVIAKSAFASLSQIMQPIQQVSQSNGDTLFGLCVWKEYIEVQREK